MRTLTITLLALLFAVIHLNAQQPARPAPAWVSSRPNNAFKFIGIGFEEKSKGGNYQLEAKKNALYDLASEIKVDISSNSVLYTVQNSAGFKENFNSLIQLSNTDNIEGYTLVDSYENEKQYWVYYQLDKQEYADRKAQKKQQIINKASALIASAALDEKHGEFSSSLKKRIQAFGTLTAYLSEDIVFDPGQAGGLRNIIDLTSLIQQQLQSISVAGQSKTPVVKPFQPVYQPLAYHLVLKNMAPLLDFPFLASSEDEKINVNEITSTNGAGDLQVKVISVEPLNQLVAFNLSPDITRLMGSDSVGIAGVAILRQFIQTPALKVYVNVGSISLSIRVSEKNLGKVTGGSVIENMIRQKFSGQEIFLTDKPETADYLIDCDADTKEDISSDVLEKRYALYLASLSISLQLKSNPGGEILYRGAVSDVYGYGSSLEKAGMSAYSNPKLNGKVSEAVFFLKRKVIVY
jgi:hypothetical protein